MGRAQAKPISSIAASDGHLRILSVSVFSGFLDGLRLSLSPGLSCIIGPRGAGKSTALELIRYALDLLPDRDTSPQERKRLDNLVDRNLDNGRVEVTIQTREGLTYVISRVGGEAPVVLGQDMRLTDLSVGSGVLFRAEVISQNEIEAIADAPGAQRNLIDGFEPEELGKLTIEIQRVHETLDSNASRIESVEDRLVGLADEIALLQDVEAKLAQLSTPSGAEQKKFAAATGDKARRDAEHREVTSTGQMLELWQAKLRSFRSETVGRQPTLPDVGDGQNRAIMSECRSLVQSLREEIERLVANADEQLSAGRKAIQKIESQLERAHKEQDLAYRSYIESHEQLQAKSAERVRLQKRRDELLVRHDEHTEAVAHKDALLQERADLLDRLDSLQSARFKARQAITKKINAELSPMIRVKVQQFGDRQAYREFVTEMLKDHGRLKHSAMAQRLTDAFGPAELAKAIRERDVKSLVKVSAITTDQAEKVASALARLETLLRLESIALEDATSIELKDGKDYKESTELSKGQKCTAILPILLLERDHPLLIDQPEDNLDNRFIFQTIVEGIRRVKGRRQLIFVTHNPNIPVLGDAEVVAVLESDGRRSKLVEIGSVDECQGKIVELLEGGEEAFKLRQSRYQY